MFNKILKDYRKAEGITQRQLAEKVSCHVSTIKQYEAGNREPYPHNLAMFPDEVILNYMRVLREGDHNGR